MALEASFKDFSILLLMLQILFPLFFAEKDLLYIFYFINQKKKKKLQLFASCYTYTIIWMDEKKKRKEIGRNIKELEILFFFFFFFNFFFYSAIKAAKAAKTAKKEEEEEEK